jgi:hypothetical protein
MLPRVAETARLVAPRSRKDRISLLGASSTQDSILMPSGSNLAFVRSISAALISSILVLLAPMVASGPVVATTGICGNSPPYYLKYARQFLPGTTSNGLDGDINGAVVTLDDPTNQHIAEWVHLANTANVPPDYTEWVEIGQIQGCGGACPNSPCLYTPITIHQYAESQCSTSYTFQDLAQVPQANFPVYVWYRGSGPLSGHCAGQTSYEFGFRTGSWCTNCTPVGLGYLRTKSAYDEAAVEVKGHSVYPPVGRTYLGADNNHLPNNSYALHTYVRSTNTWHVWSESSYPGTQCQPSSMTYYTLRAWDAFWADDEGLGNC